jgi:hypothetical protein
MSASPPWLPSVKTRPGRRRPARRARLSPSSSSWRWYSEFLGTTLPMRSCTGSARWRWLRARPSSERVVERRVWFMRWCPWGGHRRGWAVTRGGSEAIVGGGQQPGGALAHDFAVQVASLRIRCQRLAQQCSKPDGRRPAEPEPRPGRPTHRGRAHRPSQQHARSSGAPERSPPGRAASRVPINEASAPSPCEGSTCQASVARRTTRRQVGNHLGLVLGQRDARGPGCGGPVGQCPVQRGQRTGTARPLPRPPAGSRAAWRQRGQRVALGAPYRRAARSWSAWAARHRWSSSFSASKATNA